MRGGALRFVKVAHPCRLIRCGLMTMIPDMRFDFRNSLSSCSTTAALLREA